MKDLIERIKDHVLTLKSLYIPQPVRETIAEQINLDLDELQKLVDEKENNNLLDKIVDGKRVPIPYEPLGPKDLSKILPQEKQNPFKIPKQTPWWEDPYIMYCGSNSTAGKFDVEPCTTTQASASNQKPLFGTITFNNGGSVSASAGHTLKITSEKQPKAGGITVISGDSGNILGTITSTNGGHITFRSSGEVLRPINANDMPHSKLIISEGGPISYRIKKSDSEPLYVGSINYQLSKKYEELLDAAQQAMKEDKPEFDLKEEYKTLDERFLEAAEKIQVELEKNPEYKEQVYKYMAEQRDLPEDTKKKYRDCLDEVKKEYEGWVVKDESIPDQLELYWSEQIRKLERIGTPEAMKQIEELKVAREAFEKHRQEVMKKTLELQKKNKSC